MVSYSFLKPNEGGYQDESYFCSFPYAARRFQYFSSFRNVARRRACYRTLVAHRQNWHRNRVYVRNYTVRATTSAERPMVCARQSRWYLHHGGQQSVLHKRLVGCSDSSRADRPDADAHHPGTPLAASPHHHRVTERSLNPDPGRITRPGSFCFIIQCRDEYF